MRWPAGERSVVQPGWCSEGYKAEINKKFRILCLFLFDEEAIIFFEGFMIELHFDCPIFCVLKSL